MNLRLNNIRLTPRLIHFRLDLTLENHVEFNVGRRWDWKVLKLKDWSTRDIVAHGAMWIGAKNGQFMNGGNDHSLRKDQLSTAPRSVLDGGCWICRYCCCDANTTFPSFSSAPSSSPLFSIVRPATRVKRTGGRDRGLLISSLSTDVPPRRCSNLCDASASLYYRLCVAHRRRVRSSVYRRSRLIPGKSLSSATSRKPCQYNSNYNHFHYAYIQVP